MEIPTRPAVRTSERRHHHDHDEDDRRDDVVLQVAQHVADVFGLVLREAHLHAVRPVAAFLLHQRAHVGDGVDDVGADPLGNFEHDGGLAVHPRETGGVLEGAPRDADVSEGEHSIAARLDRHFEYVFRLLEEPGHLHREAPLPGVQCARGHELVVACDGAQQRARSLVEALQAPRVDEHFEHVFPVPGNVRLQHSGKPLQLVAQAPGEADQHPLGDVAVEGHHDDRKERHVDLVHRGLLGIAGELVLGDIHLFAHVIQGLVGIEARLELEHEGGLTLPRSGAQFLQALDVAQFLLHRPHQQALRVLGRDAVVRNQDVDDGNRDVGVRLLRDGHVGDGAGDEDQGQHQQHRPGPPHRGVDDAIQLEAPSSAISGTAMTRCPARTKPCPTVMTRTGSGRPDTQTPLASARRISVE